jgi:hypothetical protein
VTGVRIDRGARIACRCGDWRICAMLQAPDEYWEWARWKAHKQVQEEMADEQRRGLR